MEGMVKKYQQRFRKAKDEMERWETLQSRLLSQFRNASSIVDRLQVIQSSANYGALNNINGVKDVVFRKQIDSLGAIFRSMNATLEEFRRIVLSLEKMHRDGKQLVNGGSGQAITTKQLQLRIGVKPSLAICLDGLLRIHDMHRSEYLLKASVVSALSSLTLSSLTLEPSSSDLSALQQLLVDQPNIPKEEVQLIFDLIFAEEIC